MIKLNNGKDIKTSISCIKTQNIIEPVDFQPTFVMSWESTLLTKHQPEIPVSFVVSFSQLY